jgi:UDP-GlcNAc:undecaprenyl-phosphate GlcNAc-1-phosphate transferase
MSRNIVLNEFLPYAALAAALVICVWADPAAKYLGVVDAPDGERKHHSHPTPLVGGIAIMLSLLLWGSSQLIFGTATESPLLIAVLLCGLGIALVGFADDQSSTLPLARASSLVVFVLIALAIDRELISRPYLYWGSFVPSHVPAAVLAMLLCVSMTGFVNAVNMADGQNGIVAGMYAIWAFCFALTGNGEIAAIALLLLAASVIVLAFNMAGRLFLGDCGTYGVSFVFGLLAIAAHAKGLISVETIVVWFFIPVVDCLRLTFMRPIRGVSPVNAGRDHFHHRLQDKLGQDLGLLSYVGIVAASSLVAAFDSRFDLVCIIALSAIYFSFAFVVPAPAAREGDTVPGDQSSSPNVIRISDGETVRKALK